MSEAELEQYQRELDWLVLDLFQTRLSLLDHQLAGRHCLHLLGLDYFRHIYICIYSLEVLLIETALLFVCFEQQG